MMRMQEEELGDVDAPKWNRRAMETGEGSRRWDPERQDQCAGCEGWHGSADSTRTRARPRSDLSSHPAVRIPEKHRPSDRHH
jgi:hypothetical protein